MSTMLSPHFSVEELTASATAKALNIDNTPTDIALNNLKRLARSLEMVRDYLNAPLRISSGYRSPVLNVAVGGSKSSRHCDGLAADFTPKGWELSIAFATLTNCGALPYDQLILERTKDGAAWIHLGLCHEDEKPRRQALNALGTKGHMIYRTAAD